MSKGIIGLLYGISRTTGKIATALTDVKVLSSGDANKITKRIERKAVNKVTNEIRKGINKGIR